MPRRWSMIGLLPVNLQPCSTSICCTIQLWGRPYFSHSCRCLKKICRMGRRDMNLFLFLLVHVFVVFNSSQVECNFVDITYVESAVTEGAVCLDGSPSAYHLSPGFGIGVDNWLVQFEGGWWCNNVAKCLARKVTRLGSSRAMLKKIAFSGILSNNPQHNPGEMISTTGTRSRFVTVMVHPLLQMLRKSIQ